MRRPVARDEAHLSLEERLSSLPILEKLIQHRRLLPYACIFLLLFSAILFKYTKNRQSQVESNYLAAEAAFRKLSDPDMAISEEHQGLLIGRFQQLLTKRPDLNQRYSGRFAQVLLALGKKETALPFGQDTLSRVGELLALPYLSFSTTSLAAPDDQLALAEALLLQEAKSPNLRIANLLRLNALHAKLGNTERQLDTLNALETLLLSEAGSNAELNLLLEQGSFTLSRFLVEQKNKLLSKVE